MHFYQDIERDIKSLWDKDIIEEANQLNQNLGGIYFENNIFPMYFNGDIKSNTVLIMLNPGFQDRTYSFSEKIKGRTDKSFDDYVNEYINQIPFKASEEEEFNRIDRVCLGTKKAYYIWVSENKLKFRCNVILKKAPESVHQHHLMSVQIN